MTRIRASYVILSGVIVSLGIVMGGFGLIWADWQAAHRSYSVHMPPVDWLRYSFDFQLAKIRRSFFRSSEVGLPQVRLFVPLKAQKTLLSDVPVSTKLWQRAYRLRQDGTLQKIKVRYRGDNPINWMFGKKSWRIKTRKTELIDRVRRFDYLVPQNMLLVPEYSSLALAKKVGVLAADSRLVELFVNNESQGVLIEVEGLGESFLRNSGLMPINLYKGEQFNTEAKERLDDNLFGNAGLWAKTAVFNQRPAEDKSDLKRFLNAIRRAENSEQEFEELLELVTPEIWGRFSAYQVLVQSLHNDWLHNMRIAIDPWSGFVHPLSHDTSTTLPLPESKKPFIASSSHPLFRLLHKHNEFLKAKYSHLYRFAAEERALSQMAAWIRSAEQQIDNSVERDIHLVQYLSYGSGKRELTDVDEARTARRDFADALEAHEVFLRKTLSQPVSARWTKQSNSGIALTLDGFVPLSGLRLAGDGKAPRRVVFDVDNNGELDPGDLELPFTVETNGVRIAAEWYANHLSWPFAENSSNLYGDDIQIVPTSFPLLFDPPYSVRSVHAANGLTGVESELPRSDNLDGPPSRFNRPLFETKKEELVWQGDILIDEDQVMRRPTRILAGTRIRMAPGASLVFRSRLVVDGTPDRPVRVVQATAGQPWGTFALQGRGSAGSRIRSLSLVGGSGDEVGGVRYISMLSLHDVEDVEIDGLVSRQNAIFDDMVHIIYSDRVRLRNARLSQVLSDAIDVDMSTFVELSDLQIDSAGNDALDFMESTAMVERADLVRSGDKGASVGENSSVAIFNSRLVANGIGVESKDLSIAQLVNVDLIDNKVHLSAYSKNWRYGGGGTIDVRRSVVAGGGDFTKIEKKSRLKIHDSSIPVEVAESKKIERGENVEVGAFREAREPELGDGLLPILKSRSLPGSVWRGAFAR